MSQTLGSPLYYYINSKNRLGSSDTASDFTISLEQYKTGIATVDKICLLNFSCGKSWYLIDEHDSFTIVEEGINRTITLSQQNYTFSSLKNELQSQLNTGKPIGYNYVVNSNPATGKYLIVVTGYVLPVEMIFDQYELATILGFIPDTTYTFIAGELSSINIVRLQLVTSILLCCDIVDATQGILCNIPVDAVDLGNVNYTTYDVHMNSRSLITNKSSTIKFTLLNAETLEKINFNGVNVSFDIILYKHNDSDEIRRNEIIINNAEEKLKSLA